MQRPRNRAKQARACAYCGIAAILTLFLTGCRPSGLPKPDTKAYLDEVTAFYVGLAALQVGDDVRADATLERATQLAPGEPAGWANWGLLALRQGNFDVSAQRLGQAQKLVPQNGQLHYLSGVLESKRGNPSQAITELRKAVQISPRNLRAMYLLAQEIERQGDANGAAEFQQLLEKILVAQPDNPAALLELGRVAAKRGDAQTLHTVVSRLSARAATWPPEVQQQWTALQAAAAGPDPRSAAVRIAFLRNSLMRVPDFRQSLNLIQPTAGNEATPFTRFLLLPSPTFAPAPADTAINFHAEAVTGLSSGSGSPWTWIGSVSLSGARAPATVVGNSHIVKLSTGAELPFPGGSANAPLRPESILPVDFNYDFKTDLVLAGEGGVRFFRQESPTSFTDVTAQTKLPPALLHDTYTGAWAIDVEADGDMDILLGAHQGPPLVLRNNGDGTFTAIHPFNSISGLRGLAWVDLDGDGNPDAAMIDGSGILHFFHNQRGGVFSELPLPANLPPVKAVTVADVSSSGTLDLVALEQTGALVAITRADDTWNVAPLGNAPHLANEVRLHAADLDNNGAVDLLLLPVGLNPGDFSGAFIWLNDGARKFTLLPAPVGSPRVFDVADLNADGKLDLLGLSPNGEAQQALNLGSKNYHWQILRPRARVATGDQRINSFGIGGEMELRSGLLVQKQAITSPQLHFGLGEQTSADVVTILWPNGMQNAEFALKADQEVLTEQRLKGSCPFLFAWNGKQMSFVKDAVPWGSAIGLQIDSVGSPGIAATEEWYKINRDQLAPHHGYYDLRLTGELWETFYYDYLKLMVVDHPAGTEIFTDERFVVPAPKLTITTVAPPHAIAKATDDQGTDVTATVSNLDGKYLDTFGRGQYQGLTRDHYVEVDLGNDVPASGPLWLIARGWVHPTDSSVNVAISQGHHQKHNH